MTIYYFADNQAGAHASAAVGNNANSGTSPASPKRVPWTNGEGSGLNYGALVPGDQVLFAIGGCWDRTGGGSVISIPDDLNGSSTNPIIFGSYDPGTGATGKPWLKSGDTGGIVVMIGSFHGTTGDPFRGGFTIRDLKVDALNPSGTNGGKCIYIWSNNEWITIENCDVQNAHEGITSSSGPAAADNNRYILIRNNTFTDIGFAGWLGHANDCLIEKNTFLRCGKRLSVDPTPDDSGFHHGIYYGAGSATARTVIRHNTLTDSTTDQGYAAGGQLTFRGQLTYTNVEDNTIYNSIGAYTGFAFGISHFAAYDVAETNAKTIIRGNKIINLGVGIYYGSAPNILIENNTYIDLTTTNTAGQGAISGSTPGNIDDAVDTGAVIRNNSIYIARANNGAVGIRISADAGANLNVNNNAVVIASIGSGSAYSFSLNETATYSNINNNFRSGGSGWHSGYTTLAAFESHFDALSGTNCTGNVDNATHGLTVPTLGNSWNLVPTSNSSPVVNAGSNILGTKLAIGGYARDTTYDIGAYEYGRNPA